MSQTDTPTVNHTSYTYTPLATATWTPTFYITTCFTPTAYKTNTYTGTPTSSFTPTPYVCTGGPVTMGSAAVAESVVLGNNAGFAVRFTAASNGFVRRICSTGGNLQFALYDDQAGAPGLLMTRADSASMNYFMLNGTYWMGAAVASVAVTVGQTYWIACSSTWSGGGPVTYQTGGSAGAAYTFNWPSSYYPVTPLPDQFSLVSGVVADPNLFSAFVEVCTNSGPTATPTSLYTMTPTYTPLPTNTPTPTPTGTWATPTPTST